MQVSWRGELWNETLAGLSWIFLVLAHLWMTRSKTEEACAAAMPAPKGDGEDCETQPTLHTIREESETKDENVKKKSRNFAGTRAPKGKKEFESQGIHAEGSHRRAGKEKSGDRRSEPGAAGSVKEGNTGRETRARSNSGGSGGSEKRTDDNRGGGRAKGLRW